MRLLLPGLLTLAFCNGWSQTLVLPGDHPDPSVAQIGDSYWASATTSNWAPAFPLLQSKDLIHWETRGHVFSELPAWSDYYFWAPEISYDNGKVYMYYAAHRQDGNLCVAVASADRPEGPYRDHGPLMCQPVGSIDAFPMRDESGKLFLIWKEDGNSVKQPTPIWAMEMNEERTALTGEKKELFRNDQPWEANLVEGVSMIRHGSYIYAFYAAAGCCGRDCSYQMGIARATNLLGPWEKYGKNPLFRDNAEWKCPGHGTPVQKDGKFYLLYHAYHAEGDVYAGRQGLLKEFTFTPDGWIALAEDDLAAAGAPSGVSDPFSGPGLSPQWQWSVFHTPDYAVRNGKLELNALPGPAGAFLGQKILTADYKASLSIFSRQSGAEGGLAIVGDEKNLIAITVLGNKLLLWQLKDGRKRMIKEAVLEVKDCILLRAVVRHGKDIDFHYSINGTDFQKFNENAVDGAYLPPWDRAIRVSAIAIGNASDKAIFDDFVLESN